MDCPEMQLSDAEAEAYAAACIEVGKQYDIVVNPKVAAWLHLIGVTGTVYGTRLYAMHIRRQQTAVPKPPNNVVDMKPTGKPGTAGANGAGDRAQTPADVFGLNYSGSIAAEI